MEKVTSLGYIKSAAMIYVDSSFIMDKNKVIHTNIGSGYRGY